VPCRLHSSVHVGQQQDTAKGNRPSFSEAARPEQAEPVYGAFCAALRALGVEVATGVFGARMAVELVNDGPVTIVVEASAPAAGDPL
jgi:D-aminoacyl-tRNA deacylase